MRDTWEGLCDGSTFHVIACVGGAFAIRAGDQEERLTLGEFTLLPASLGRYNLAPLADGAQALKVFVAAAGL